MVSGTVPVELSAGHTWKLRYDTAAFMALEDATGKSLGQVQAQMGEGSITAIVTTLWAGLLWAEPKLTVTEVGKRLDMQLLTPVVESLGEALQVALGVDPDADEEDEEDEDQEGNGEAQTG